MPVLPGDPPDLPPVEITLRRSARARRFSLRVSRLDGRVTLSLPMRAAVAEAMAFARAQEGWIRDTLAQMRVPASFKLNPRSAQAWAETGFQTHGRSYD